MIIDDLRENLQLLTEIFETEGFRVRAANSGELALLSIAKKDPDIILLDVKMPEMDGFEVCRRLKSNDATKEIPVIFITALDELDDKIRGLELGAVDFISKPFDKREIVMRVKNHIELRKLHLEIQNSEVHYRMLFNSMMNGYATHEMLFDEKGNPYDYRYIDVNPAFEKMTGIRRDQWIGKTVREVLPGIEDTWIQTFGKVVTTGVPIVYENHVKEMDKYFQTYVFTSKKNHFSVIANDITESKILEKKIFEEKEQLRITFESIGDGIITTDTKGCVVSMNRVAEELTGWRVEEARGIPFEKVFVITNEDTGEKAKNPVKEVLELDVVCELENHTLLTSSQGIIRNISDSAAPIKDVKGDTTGVVMVFEDVTDKKRSEKRLKQSLEIIEKMKTGVYIYQLSDFNDDHTLRLVFANDASTTQLGIEKEDAIGRYIDDIFPNLRKNGIPHKFAEVVRTGIAYEAEEFDYDDDNIIKSSFSFKVFKLQKDSVCVLFENITERKKYFDEVRFLSFHDALTGLFNRAYLQKELVKRDTENNLPISIIMGDVNGLKLINDVFGHEKGDQLLKNTAKILRDCCPKDSIIARWGGDEFVVLMSKTSHEMGKNIIQEIKNKCDKKYLENIALSISMGLSTKSTRGVKATQVLQEAEDAMYTHKLIEGKSVRGTIIASLEKTLFEKSCETLEHAMRLTELAMKLAQKISLSPYEANELKLLAKLHDIGKIGVRDELLNKPDRLTAQEWIEIRKHSEIGYRIAHSTPELAHISELILCHHEHWDGQGYPQGLKEENIPMLSRVMAIIDAYDVMTNHRPYSPPKSKVEALAEIKRCAGKQFDPRLVEIFLEIMQ